MTSDAICGTDQALLAQDGDEGLRDMEPRQCRAARSLLGITQKQLADLAGVSTVTLHGFERGVTTPTRATIAVLRLALEKAGVEFIDDGQPGVRMKKGRK